MRLSQQDDAHSRHSVLREKIIEHLFVGGLLQLLWQKSIYDAEILRYEYDGHGYDVVVSRGKLTRYIQLKSGVQDRPSALRITRAIAAKQGGCVVWLGLDRDSIDIVSYWFFEDFSGSHWSNAPLAKALKYQSDRSRKLKPEIAILRRLERLHSLDALLERLLSASTETP